MPIPNPAFPEDTIIDFTVDGKCSRCGACCTSIVPVSEKEKKTLLDYAEKHGIDPKLPAFPNDLAYILCPFLRRETKECLAYPIRPAACRAFLCSGDIAANARRYARICGKGEAIPTNLWELFGKTGIRIGGREVTVQNAPSAILTDDQGIQWPIRVGRPVRFSLRNGTIVGPAVVLSLAAGFILVFNAGEVHSYEYIDIEKFL